MRIMTFNIRFENDVDGDNAWCYRRDLVVGVVGRIRPWILGTQEGTRRQLAYLQDRLPEYGMYAGDRPDDETCQYPTLFYRRDRLRLLEGGEFWLSLTPLVHRSKDWDSAFPRMMSYGLFEDVREKRRMWAVVTHLDHIGERARVEQAGMIARWIKGLQPTCPVVLMGDFNDMPGSGAHRSLTDREGGLLDTWQVLEMAEDQSSMTHHDFRGVPGKCRMDWVLVSEDFVVRDVRIIRDHFGGRYPSDHFPYAVDLDWAHAVVGDDAH